MADNPSGTTFRSIQENRHDLEPKSNLNKHCAEFKPRFSHTTAVPNQKVLTDEEYLSTMGSALDELLSQAMLGKLEDPPTGSVSPSPMPSTAHATPQMSSAVLPPPPGYDPIVENAASYESNIYYDPSMYSSPTCSWRSYPPPFHLGYKLFVGALPYSVCEADLFPLFSQFGDILELHIQRDWLGRSKGCAWLRYSSIDECDAAIDALHNNYFLGSMNRPMQLTYASDNDKKSTRARTASYSVQSVGGDSAAAPEVVPDVILTQEIPSRPRAMTEQIQTTSVLGKLRAMMSSTTSIEIPESLQSSTPVKEAGDSLTRFSIAGFPPEYSHAQLDELLSQFGQLEKIDRMSESRASVEFRFPRDADRARSVMEGVTLPGCDSAISIENC
jgi:RNA recognition motif-containing protein